jgi:competence protein ComEA
MAGLLVAALGLLGWNAFVAGRWSARPTSLEPGGLAFRVDLNQADHTGLLQLPGVGESLARRIQEHRERYGPFRAVEDLRNVSGIGPATLERLRPFVYAQPPEPGGEDLAPEGEPTQRPARRDTAGTPRGKTSERPSTTKKADALTGLVDLNRATAEELQHLPGVGPAMSARIVAAREQKAFRAVEDLRRVRGIGAKTLERLRPHVAVGDDAGQAARDEQGKPK